MSQNSHSAMATSVSVCGYEHEPLVNPAIKPVMQSLRRIPYALREEVSAEPCRLKKGGKNSISYSVCYAGRCVSIMLVAIWFMFCAKCFPADDGNYHDRCEGSDSIC